MAFGFSAPDIHGVSAIRAKAGDYRDSVAPFCTVRFTFIDERGQEAEFSAFLEAHSLGYAQAVADAINAVPVPAKPLPANVIPIGASRHDEVF